MGAQGARRGRGAAVPPDDDGPAHTRSSVAGTTGWPLIGRRNLVTAAAAHAAQGRSVALRGPRGVGKTRVVAAVAEAYPGPVVTVDGVGDPRRVPFGGLRTSLPELAGQEHLTLAEVRDTVTARMVDLARGGQLLIAVDDAHLLDPTTALGLEGAIREVPWVSVLVAVTHGHALPASIAACMDADLCQQVTLDPFDDTEIECLVEAVLGARADAVLLAQLRHYAEGVPSTCVELAQDAVETGAAQRDGDVWRAVAPLPVHRVRTHVVDLLDRSDPVLLAAAELVALGGPLSPSVVAELIAPTCLEELAVQDVVRWETAGGRRGLVVAHANSGEVLRSRLDPATRERAAQRLRAAVGRTGSADAAPDVVAAGPTGVAPAAAPAAAGPAAGPTGVAPTGVAPRRPNADTPMRMEARAHYALMAAAVGRLATTRSYLQDLDRTREAARTGPTRLLGGVAAVIALDEAPGDAVLRTWVPDQPRFDPDATRTLPVGMAVLLTHYLAGHGETDHAAARVNSTLDRALVSGREDDRGWWLAVAGHLHLLSGDIVRARRWLHDATVAFGRSDPLRIRPLVVARLALAMVRGGAPTGARRWLDTIENDRTDMPRVEACARQAEVEIAAVVEDPSSVGRDAISVGDVAVAQGLEMSALAAWELAVRLGAGRESTGRLQSQEDRCPTPHGRRVLAAAEAMAGADGSRLEAVAMDVAASGRRFLAAELLVHAQRFGAGHRTGQLLAGLRTSCAGVGTDVLAGVPVVTLPHRARELARRAVEGVSSSQLADEFDVSVRTVDNHLGRVYRTLGVSGRRALARCYPPSVPPLAPSISRPAR